MVEAGFEMMEAYIRRNQNMVAQYIGTQSLMELCEATDRNQGARVEMRWWEQAGIDMRGKMETALVAEESDEDWLEE